MRERSGRRIGTRCTVVCVDGDAERLAVDSEASDIMWSTFYPEEFAELKRKHPKMWEAQQ
jgi:hypothetical protein